jgi:hypothetical protein
MAAGRRVAAPNAAAARTSGIVFALLGAAAVLGGVVSILLGLPSAAHDLAPLTGPGDAVARFGQIAPLVSAGIAALVAGWIAILTARRRLDPWAASLELLVLGIAVCACTAGAIGRVGHAANGDVLPAAVVCMMGGAALVAGGIVALLGHE